MYCIKISSVTLNRCKSKPVNIYPYFDLCSHQAFSWSFHFKGKTDQRGNVGKEEMPLSTMEEVGRRPLFPAVASASPASHWRALPRREAAAAARINNSCSSHLLEVQVPMERRLWVGLKEGNANTILQVGRGSPLSRWSAWPVWANANVMHVELDGLGLFLILEVVVSQEVV